VTLDGIALPSGTVQRIACGAAIVYAIVGSDGTPMDVGRRTRKINTLLRRALLLRDGGRCRFPGCESTRRLHAHRIRHWAAGGETKLANLITLCTAHHWAVHEGGHLVWTGTDGRLHFADPNGRLLPNAPTTGPASGNEAIGYTDIGPETIGPGWDGTPLNLSDAVLALLQPAPQR
jgi:hypothetical protein